MRSKLAFILTIPALMLVAADAAPPTVPAVPFVACAGIDMAKIRAPIARLFTDHPETRAVSLTVDRCAPVKLYAPGYSDRNRFISWSMAKTITGMLIGELVVDRRLSLDAPVPLAEWQRAGDPHGAITLRQMMQMASGVAHIEVGDPVHDSNTNQTLFVSGTQAMAKDAMAEPVEVTPGSRFEYNSLTSLLLAELATRQITDSHDPRTRAIAYRAFAQQRLFGPAGITSAVMDFDGSGTQIGGSFLYMTLDDWARIGALLVDGKGPNGDRIVDPDWLAFMKTSSAGNAEYGAQTWINVPSTAEKRSSLFPGKGPPTTVAMDGHLGQLVIAAQGIVDGTPHRLVLVRLGNTPDKANPALMQALGDVVEAVVPHDADPIAP